VLRPADATETAEAWKIALEAPGPVALILTRQDVPVLEGTGAGVASGGYVIRQESGDQPDLILVGTGSEVSLCVEAAALLEAGGLSVRVVSLPSWELFEAGGEADRDAVLTPGVPSLSVEAGVTYGWDRYADMAIGIDRFGASAPGSVALDRLGMNVDHICRKARALLEVQERNPE
jgi:transketolase